MKLSAKILTTALSLVSILLGLMLIAAMVWLPFDVNARSRIAELIGHPLVALCGAVCALGLITLAVFTMISVFKRQGETKIPVVKSENGDTFLTIPALCAMIRQYLAQEHITNETRIDVSITEGKADVTAIVRVLPNTVMADFSNRLQKGVKEYLEAYAGIQVSRVTVILEALPAESAQEPVQARVR